MLECEIFEEEELLPVTSSDTGHILGLSYLLQQVWLVLSKTIWDQGLPSLCSHLHLSTGKQQSCPELATLLGTGRRDLTCAVAKQCRYSSF